MEREQKEREARRWFKDKRRKKKEQQGLRSFLSQKHHLRSRLLPQLR